MKRTTKSIMGFMWIAAMSAVVIIFSACEKDAETDLVDDFFNDSYRSENRDAVQPNELAITPVSPSVDTIGEKVAFGISGGKKPYKWSVSDASSGTISPTTTENEIKKVVYTCIALKKNTVICTDALGRAVTVDVTAATPNLTISPTAIKFFATSMLVAPAQSYTFSTTGGRGTISWKTDNVSRGTVAGGVWTSIPDADASGWSNAVIKVIATDEEGTAATSTITFE